MCGKAVPAGKSAAPRAMPPRAAPGPTPDPFETEQNPTMMAVAGAVLHLQQGPHVRAVVLVADVMTVGRRDDNAIVLPFPFVSEHHCRIERHGSAHRIVDTGSAGGLWFNGTRVAATDLLDGDAVRIADPRTGNFVTLTYMNPLAPRVAQAGRVARNLALPRGGAPITLGRAGADLVLDNPQVSRRHAQVGWVRERHVLRDLRSTNGTYVNGARARREVALAPGDVIQIGPFKLRYDGERLDEYDQRGAMRIDARGLRREVPASRGFGRRVILDDVSLCIEPREFVALVGGSGAGKSTLLLALAGYARADKGTVAVNGDDFYAHFDAYKCTLGFVPQDDIVHGALRVERALTYAARLRLPADTGNDEVVRRVDRVLEAVDMTAHRDQRIDQLSGGQRKRVSIASELLNDPSLLFLDEPTSGLDPGLEKKMMFTLRALADSGRTVVLVTHATANITQCDHVVFMSEGKVVYFGPPGDALGFFGVTSGDFADIYARLEGAADPASPLVREVLRDEHALWKSQHPRARRPATLADLWQVRWSRSAQYQRYVVDRLALRAPGPAARQLDGTRPAQAARASAFRQFRVLARRYFDVLARDRRNLAIILMQAPVVAALLCLVSGPEVLTGGQNPYEAKKLLFLLATVGVWFGIVNAAREVCKERSILRRERLADLRVGPYVASKVAVLLGLVMVQSAILLGVVSAQVVFPERGVVWPASVEMFVTTVLAGVAGLSIGLLISAVSSTPDKAISVVPLALIPQILFAGLLFRLEGASTGLSWITASRWAMDAFGTIVDLNAFHFANGALAPAEDPYEHTALHLLQCWSLLGAYASVCIATTVSLLRRQT